MSLRIALEILAQRSRGFSWEWAEIGFRGKDRGQNLRADAVARETMPTALMTTTTSPTRGDATEGLRAAVRKMRARHRGIHEGVATRDTQGRFFEANKCLQAADYCVLSGKGQVKRLNTGVLTAKMVDS